MSTFFQGEVLCFFKGQPVATSVKYFPSQDPYALVFIFFTPEPVQWTFARDLLLSGLTKETGLGDVKFRPDGEHVIMSITDGTQLADFAFLRADMETIAAMTEELMPQGKETEEIDWDTELAQLLSE